MDRRPGSDQVSDCLINRRRHIKEKTPQGVFFRFQRGTRRRITDSERPWCVFGVTSGRCRGPWRACWPRCWPAFWAPAGSTSWARWKCTAVCWPPFAAVCRRLPASLRFEAITLGHVVLGLDTACLDGARAHEQVHVRQYERWGPLFVPLYLASSGWQWLRGGCPYRDNHFEREACALAPVCHLPAAANDRAMVE